MFIRKAVNQQTEPTWMAGLESFGSSKQFVSWKNLLCTENYSKSEGKSRDHFTPYLAGLTNSKRFFLTCWSFPFALVASLECQHFCSCIWKTVLKTVVYENKSLLVRKRIITGLKRLTSGFWDLAKISWKTTGYFHFNQWFLVNFWLSPKHHWLIFSNQWLIFF